MSNTSISARNWRDLLILVASLKASAFLILYLGFVFMPAPAYQGDLWITRADTSFIEHLANFDGAWFVRVAALGYQRLAHGDYDLAAETKRLRVMDQLGYQQALWPRPQGDTRIDRGYGYRHWPGMVYAIRALHLIFRDYVLSGVVAASLCHLIYMIFLYLLVRLDFPHRTALWAVALCSLHPGAYSLTGIYSEGPTLMATAGALYLCRREHWIAAGILGLLAAFTRISGIIVLVPLCCELLLRKTDKTNGRPALRSMMSLSSLKSAVASIKEKPQVLGLLLIPLGTLLAVLIFWQASGDPLVFTRVHETNVYGSIAWPWQMLLETWRKGPHVWLKELPLHAGLLIIILVTISRCRVTYGLWMIVFFLYHASNANHSYLRYQVECIPMFIVLSDLCTRHPAAGYVVTALSALASFAAGVFFIKGYWVA